MNPPAHKIMDEPIVLPKSPFWEIVKVFGKDELIALIVGTAGTALMSIIVSNPIVLAITGPVVEKVGFFLAHIKESRGLQKGFYSMIKDLVAHDPLYALFMYAGLQMHSMPAWILSIVSFIVALGFVAVGEVLITEIRYRLLFMRYKRLGFKLESYLESRFYIKKVNTEELLNDFIQELGITKRDTAKYRDLYFETNLYSFNGREPNMRLRQRTLNDNQTLQIVYTRASELSKKHPAQFNYYPTRKDKVWIRLDQPMPWNVSDIVDDKIRKLADSVTVKPTKEVVFTRELVRSPESLLVSVDQVENGSNPFTVIEIKSYLDSESKKLFIKAMRHVMLKYEVIQTTHGKSALV